MFGLPVHVQDTVGRQHDPIVVIVVIIVEVQMPIMVDACNGGIGLGVTAVGLHIVRELRCDHGVFERVVGTHRAAGVLDAEVVQPRSLASEEECVVHHVIVGACSGHVGGNDRSAVLAYVEGHIEVRATAVAHGGLDAHSTLRRRREGEVVHRVVGGGARSGGSRHEGVVGYRVALGLAVVRFGLRLCHARKGQRKKKRDQ